MESRKMVPMNLFAGQEQRHRRREQACGHGRRGLDELRVALRYIQTMCKVDSQWEATL